MIFVLWLIAAAAALFAGISGMEVIATSKSNAPPIAHFAAKIDLGLSLLVFVAALGLGGIMKKLDEIALKADLRQPEPPRS